MSSIVSILLPGLSAGQALFLLDASLGGLSWVVAWPLVAPVGPGAAPAGLAVLPAFLSANLLLLFALGLYRREALLQTRRSLLRVPLASVLGATLGAGASMLIPLAGARIEWAGVALLGFVPAGMVARVGLFMLRRDGFLRPRLMVVGAGRRAWELALLLRREGRRLTYEVVFVHDPAMGEIDPRLCEAGCRIIPAARGFLPIAREIAADQIVVAPDERRGLAMAALLGCKTAGFPVRDYLSVLEREIGRVDVKRLELSWLLFSDGFQVTLFDRVLKRALDVVVSLGALLLVAPLLLAGGIAVKLCDGGPVLYRQSRITRAGRVFRILKLRTMREDAERFGAAWASEMDPRVTRAGRFLRRTRLDELPQLLNVLRGEMSLVGPRPERPEFVEALAAQLPLYCERHIVRAGLTGWAQINYPYGASLDDARSKLSYDLFYVKNQGFLLDLLVLAQTMRVLLWPGGVR